MISGFVDGLIGDHVQGWIANLERPGSLEPLQVICDDAQPVSFLPLIHRLDVCRHLGIDGRFGFAIPIGMFGRVVQQISITTMQGRPLEGGVSIPIGEASALRLKRQRPETRVYLHIQKTSGTSLQADVAASLGDTEALYVYPSIEQGVPAQMLSQIPRSQLGSYELIFGHIGFGVHHFVDGHVTYATMIRDPIERLRSHVWHLIKLAESGQLAASGVSVVESNRSEELDNLMVRCIAGAGTDYVPYGCVNDEVLGQALANIEQHFCYVALSEGDKESYEGLLRVLRVRPRNRSRLNQVGTRNVFQTVASLQVDWPDLLHRNRFDVSLYKAVIEMNLCNRPLR